MSLGRQSYALSDLHGAEVGNFSSLAGGVTLHGSDNHACTDHPELVSTFPFAEIFEIEGYPKSSGKGNVVIGSDCWLGECARVLSGVHIGNGVIVGAGTVVTKDVPDYAVIVGNPGKIVKYRFPKKIIESLLRIKWWEWENNVIRERINDFKNINLFVETYDK